MQRTDEYRLTPRLQGDDPAGAVAWLARRRGWERRLRRLEAVSADPDANPCVARLARRADAPVRS